jgi:hypothetical protein
MSVPPAQPTEVKIIEAPVPRAETPAERISRLSHEANEQGLTSYTRDIGVGYWWVGHRGVASSRAISRNNLLSQAIEPTFTSTVIPGVHTPTLPMVICFGGFSR